MSFSRATGIPPDALWIDMISPTRDEDSLVQTHLGIEIPTREEMADIEPSEILYRENNALYMTARVLCSSDTESPQLARRIVHPHRKGAGHGALRRTPFFRHVHVPRDQAGRLPPPAGGGSRRIDRDRHRSRGRNSCKVGKRIDYVSREIFETERKKARQTQVFRAALRSIGRKGDVISNVRESMVSVERMLLFLSAAMPRPQRAHGFQAEWRTALRDVQSIEEHATFLSSKVQFLLDATLGLVTIEQNDIIKLFSVMSVIFLPPTLLASIYGMNFQIMPELHWRHGYPFAILLMVAAAVLPYVIFRWKRWL